MNELPHPAAHEDEHGIRQVSRLLRLLKAQAPPHIAHTDEALCELRLVILQAICWIAAAPARHSARDKFGYSVFLQVHVTLTSIVSAANNIIVFTCSACLLIYLSCLLILSADLVVLLVAYACLACVVLSCMLDLSACMRVMLACVA